MYKYYLIVLLSSLLLFGCSNRQPMELTAESTEEFNIYSYTPIFTDITDKTVSGNMNSFTFIHMHCDTDGNWAYIQDFKDGEQVSPLYIFEFVNTITTSDLLNEMPARNSDYIVPDDQLPLVTDFYDHLDIDDNITFRTYEVNDFILKYNNILKGDKFYDEKRIYQNGKPYCFITELSDPFTEQNVEVKEDAYIWLAKEVE